MKTLPRVVVAGAVAVMALTVSACGGAPLAPPTSQGDALPTPDENTGNTVPADAFGPGCASFPKGDASGSLTALADMPAGVVAAETPDLSTLSAALKTAGLADDISFNQPAVTVFAPTNAAFAQLKQSMGEPKYNALMADKAALTKLLNNHLVRQRNVRTTLVNAGTVPTLAGDSLRVADAGPSMTVTDGAGAAATVQCGNIPTENAIVYTIDKVLAPPTA
jgi:uncharacterized surface protein with fasciclin (FAS1) repeats